MPLPTVSSIHPNPSIAYIVTPSALHIPSEEPGNIHQGTAVTRLIPEHFTITTGVKSLVMQIMLFCNTQSKSNLQECSMQLAFKARLLNWYLILSLDISGEILLNLEMTMHWLTGKFSQSHNY